MVSSVFHEAQIFPGRFKHCDQMIVYVMAAHCKMETLIKIW